MDQKEHNTVEKYTGPSKNSITFSHATTLKGKAHDTFFPPK